MKIEIFGTGCPKCQGLDRSVRKIADELKLDAEIVKITDISEMVKRGVLTVPALFVDGKKKSEGRVPNENDLVRILKGE